MRAGSVSVDEVEMDILAVGAVAAHNLVPFAVVPALQYERELLQLALKRDRSPHDLNPGSNSID
jgi:hypothetical protein